MTDEQVRVFQRKLYIRAKQDKGFKAYSLKDKMCLDYVQMAVKMLIEPLWEADFIDTSYGFRPKRGAKDAIKQIKKNLYEGHQFIYDADLSKYFDTIPHDRLFVMLKERISDKGIESYTNVRPSMKSRSKLFTKIRELLRKRRHWRIEPLIYKLNELLIGWLNYFSISKVTHICETIKVIIKHLDYKLFKWLKSKGRKAHKKLRQHPYSTFVQGKGLLDLEKYARLKTLAKAQ